MTADNTRAQVARLLNPASVAVIGATEDLTKFGGRAFRNLVTHRFTGEIYPINPRREQVLGIPAFPTIAATPRPPDVALLAIPKAATLAAVQECADAGVGTAVVITSQFAETGPSGARDEQVLVEVARGAGMRLVGPNCLGLFSPANGFVLTSSPALDIPELRAGAVGLVSQSGALLATVFDRANDLGITFSHCVSVGNQADLEAGDFVDYLIEDERTRVICSYVEGFADPGRLVPLAERARAAGKPWLLVKAGRAAAGQRAAFSHTASLAGDYAVLEAVAHEVGVTLMDDPDAMLLTAATLARFDCTPLKRVAIVTTSGGGGAIAADRLADAGIELARFAPATVVALEPLFMPGQASNPIDLGGRRAGEAVNIAGAALGAIANDPESDALLLVLSTAPLLDQIAADLAQAAADSGTPHLFVVWPGSAADAARRALLDAGAPFCDRLDDAVRALAGWARWSDFTPSAPEPRPSSLSDVSALLTQSPAGPLDEAILTESLAAYGVPVNASQFARTADEAVSAAETLGYPVALKVVADGVTHKSDLGGVALDLVDAAAVCAAWEQLRANLARHAPDAAWRGARVQRMAHGDAELLMGVKRDAQFGPLIMVGAGGVLVELLGDIQLARAPLGPHAAGALLRRLRCWPLLAGTRGRPTLDVAAVADSVSRVSWLAWDARARLVELEINPLLVATDGVVAVDARGLVG